DARRALVGAVGIEPGAELKELERRILAQDTTLLPPAARRSRRSHAGDLPVPATPFVGRERELEAVVALLTDEDVRLLTLTGPGGTGKPRRPWRAAAEVVDRFPDGLVWVALSPLRDPGLVAVTIAETLAIGEEPGVSLIQALADALGAERALLLLDNPEHLLPPLADTIAALPAGGLRLLVQRRLRRQLLGEHLYSLPPSPPAHTHA